MVRYVFEVIEKGETRMVMEADFENGADALNNGYYYLGYKRGDFLRVRKAEGKTAGSYGELVAEICPPGGSRFRIVSGE
jgi:hypothetical protein